MDVNPRELTLGDQFNSLAGEEVHITVRKRTIPFQYVREGHLFSYTTGKANRNNTKVFSGSGDLGKAYAPYLTGSQVTASENHPQWRSRKRRPLEDIGGPFSTVKKYAYVDGNADVRVLSGSEKADPFLDLYNNVDYFGPCLPMAPSMYSFPPVGSSTESQLIDLGVTAIARCSPSNPSADLSTFLGELTGEGIPRIVGGSLKSLRSMTNRQRRKALADEHLNFQFGWLPFVNDIRQLAHAIDHATEILSQYERDSGKVVRRKYGFPAETSESSLVVADQVDPWIAPYSNVLVDDTLPQRGKVIRTFTSTRLRWFSGAFTYYIPPSSKSLTTDDVARKVIQAKKLVGARLTPDAVWNLAPWSWAVDWFSNAGDLSQNLDNWIVDNQVLVYGYMMEHTLNMYRYTYVGPDRFHGGPALPPSVCMVTETKQRIKATPYGFGLTWNGLSPLQQSILVALGLSKWRK